MQIPVLDVSGTDDKQGSTCDGRDGRAGIEVVTAACLWVLAWKATCEDWQSPWLHSLLFHAVPMAGLACGNMW